MHSLPNAPVASFSFSSIRDKDIFSSYPARIEAFSITFPVSTLNPARAADRFFTVFSAFSKSLT
jgi:hypothetical protein